MCNTDGSDRTDRSDRFMTATELALFLHVSLKFVQKHTALRRIPGQIKVGRHWRYNRIEIEKHMLGHMQFLLETPPRLSLMQRRN